MSQCEMPLRQVGRRREDTRDATAGPEGEATVATRNSAERAAEEERGLER